MTDWERRQEQLVELLLPRTRTRVSRNARIVLSKKFKGDLEEAVEDVTQISILKALAFLKNGNVENFDAWLSMIVTNACKDFLSVSAEVPVCTLSEVAEEGLLRLSSFLLSREENNPLAIALRTDEVERAVRILKPKLKEPRFQAFMLVKVMGLEYSEVARQTGLSIGTVKSRVNRAKADLDRMNLVVKSESEKPPGG